MNDQECIQSYEELKTILNERGLSWVVDQVTEQIRLGKTVQKEVETFKINRGLLEEQKYSDEPLQMKLQKGPRAMFLATSGYNPSERLNLLIDAIEQAVVNKSNMEKYLIDFIPKETHLLQEVRFYADDSGSEPRIIENQSSILRNENSKKFKALLDSLRREI